MNDEQFQALAGMLRLRPKSGSAKALRMVLVDGESLEVAAAASLIQVNHIRTVLESAQRAVERAQLLNGVAIPRF